MIRSKQQILFLLIALAVGISFPYLMEMAGRALEPQATTAALVPLNELSASQRLESACAAVLQLNKKLNRLDHNRPGFLDDIKQFQKIRPELQQVHHLVCGRQGTR